MDAPTPSLDATHEWVSFEHDGETWIFDVTFLTSSWACIWGAGCPGIGSEPAPEVGLGCCSLGAHLADAADRDRVHAAAQRLGPDQWHQHQDPDTAIEEVGEGEWATALVDEACVFWNPPGFEGGHGCALHLGALAAGESILEWKPEVCWQVPLRLEYHQDENGHWINMLREWRRHDWGEGGDDFGWWCTEERLAFVGPGPVYRRLREEIVALVGESLADRLADYLDRRPVETLLPHPVVRRA